MISTVFSAFSGWKKNSSRLPGLLAVLAITTLLTACNRSGVTPPTPTSPPPEEIWKEFSGENALQTTRELTELGPRPSGSDAIAKARQLLIGRLEKNGWSVIEQSVTRQTPRGPIRFVNLIARYGQSKPDQRFLIGAHYDTRLMETFPFVGANDGGSGPGALVELSRVLSLDPELARQVELVFFDGMEAQVQPNQADGLYGSRLYLDENTDAKKRLQAVIIWNLIGSKELAISFPYDSTRSLGDTYEAAADALGVRSLFGYATRPIRDDHRPFVEKEIPVIAVLDGNYAYRHTADDTLEALSPESLQTIGGVTLHWLKTAATKP